MIVLDPAVPMGLWWGLLLIATAVTVGYVRWRPPLASLVARLRIGLLLAVGLAVPLVLLLGFTRVERTGEDGAKAVLHVLVDRSESMAVVDAGARASRWERARAFALAAGSRLSAAYEVRYHAFDTGLAPLDARALATQRPTSSATDISGALRLLAGSDTSRAGGVLLLTDGIETAGEGGPSLLEAGRACRAAGLAVFPMTCGSAVSVRDVAVDVDVSSVVAYAGESVRVPILLRHVGLAGARVRVTLRSRGAAAGSREVRLSSEAAEEVVMQVPCERPGRMRLEAEVEPVAGEAALLNNTKRFVVPVLSEPIRVLLLEGKPYWDFKFLAATLRGDPSVSVHAVMRLGPERAIESVPDSGAGAERIRSTADIGAMLRDPSLMRRVDVVILGHHVDEFVGEREVEELRDWVARRGGSLVCARGRPMERLPRGFAAMLPVQWREVAEYRFRAEMTDRARSLRWFPGGDGVSGPEAFQLMPSLASRTEVAARSPLAEVLGTARRPGRRGGLASSPFPLDGLGANGDEASSSAGIGGRARPRPAGLDGLGTNGDEASPGGTGTPGRGGSLDGLGATPRHAASPLLGANGGGGELVVAAVHRYGLGRVVVLEGSGTWRWAFLAPGRDAYEPVYGNFWRGLVRWLIAGREFLPGQTVVLDSDRAVYGPRERPRLHALVRDGDELPPGKPPVLELYRRVTGGDDARLGRVATSASAEAAGLFEATLEPLPEGRYRASVARSGASTPADECEFEVAAPVLEKLDLTARPELLERLARSSGGRPIESDDPAELEAAMTGHLRELRPPRTQRRPAWDRPEVWAVLLALYGSTWVYRRRRGLV